MNLSGEAVVQFIKDYNLNDFSNEKLIVIHDDLDSDFGKIKIKLSSGDGGHNGIKSMISALKSNNFYRLKFGIGRPLLKEEIVNYVLQPFTVQEQIVLKNLSHIIEKIIIILALTNNINIVSKFLCSSK